MRNHGYSYHPLYKVWESMKARCYNSNNAGYKDYGSRGIIVCPKWKHSAPTFIQWAEPLHRPGLTLERFDVNGNYSPSNSGFVTPSDQIRNCRPKGNNTYVGIYPQGQIGRTGWVAGIDRKYLGYADTELEALAIRNTYIMANNINAPLQGMPKEVTKLWDYHRCTNSKNV